MKKISILFPVIAALIIIMASCSGGSGSKALILTGQNTGNWEQSAPFIKQVLDNSGLFNCEIVKSPAKGGDMTSFNPDFSKYKLVVLDYNGEPWSENTRTAFAEYVNNGGGVVIYRDAAFAFPDWKEYREICAVGGQEGPYLFWRGSKARLDTATGPSNKPGVLKESEIRNRNLEHPVFSKLPVRWIHGSDILYNRLRAVSSSAEVLATAFCDTTKGGSGHDEPVILANSYGKGRVFITLLGAVDQEPGPALQCAGFIATLQRGAEWAATGAVSQPVPMDFPSAAAPSLRPEVKELTLEDDFTNIISYDIGKSTRYYTDIQSHIRKAAGNAEELLKIEKLMVEVLKNQNATAESKKLMLKELSWMGSEYCIPAIKELSADPAVKDEADFALVRLKAN